MVDKMYQQYQEVAGLGCLIELKLRLECDVVPELSKWSYESDLNIIEEKFLDHYKNKITEEERANVVKARQLRNKIIHCNFKGLLNKVQDSKLVEVGVVHQFKLSTGTLKSVPETTKKEGGIFGWFLEISTNGSMKEAIEIFKKTIQAIDRLGNERVKAEIK